MSFNDTRAGYGWPSIAFHWIAAGLVVALFVIGEQLEDLARGPERTETLALHVSLGAIAVVVLGARILWRLVQRDPTPPADPRPIRLLSKIVQWGLLAMMAALILTGPLMQWTAGRPIDVFGLVSIASPLPTMRDLHEVLEEIHEFASHALVPLLALHVLGALKHLIVNRDDVFQRMLRGPKSDRMTAAGQATGGVAQPASDRR